MFKKSALFALFMSVTLVAPAYAAIDGVYEKQYSHNTEMLDDSGQIMDSEQEFDDEFHDLEPGTELQPSYSELGGIDYFEENQLIHMYKLNEMISL